MFRVRFIDLVLHFRNVIGEQSLTNNEEERNTIINSISSQLANNVTQTSESEAGKVPKAEVNDEETGSDMVEGIATIKAHLENTDNSAFENKQGKILLCYIYTAVHNYIVYTRFGIDISKGAETSAKSRERLKTSTNSQVELHQEDPSDLVSGSNDAGATRFSSLSFCFVNVHIYSRSSFEGRRKYCSAEVSTSRFENCEHQSNFGMVFVLPCYSYYCNKYKCVWLCDMINK